MDILYSLCFTSSLEMEHGLSTVNPMYLTLAPEEAWPIDVNPLRIIQHCHTYYMYLGGTYNSGAIYPCRTIKVTLTTSTTIVWLYLHSTPQLYLHSNIHKCLSSLIETQGSFDMSTHSTCALTNSITIFQRGSGLPTKLCSHYPFPNCPPMDVTRSNKNLSPGGDNRQSVAHT